MFAGRWHTYLKFQKWANSALEIWGLQAEFSAVFESEMQNVGSPGNIRVTDLQLGKAKNKRKAQSMCARKHLTSDLTTVKSVGPQHRTRTLGRESHSAHMHGVGLGV